MTALVELADLVLAGNAPAVAQYEPRTGYEGIIREAESHKVHRVRWDGGKKVPAAEAGLSVGTIQAG